MSVDLTVEFCGIRFKNPFILASTPASRTSKGRWKSIAESGWAGAVTWGVPHIFVGNTNAWVWASCETRYLKRKTDSLWAFQNFAYVEGTDQPIINTKLIKQHVELAKRESGLPVCFNLIAGDNIDDWVLGAKTAEEAGADILELNFSCPFAPEVGFNVGRNLDLCRRIVRSLKKNVQVPIMPKLSAHLLPDQVREAAKTLVEEGADALSAINTLLGFIGVDIETGKPLGAYFDMEGKLRGTSAGISGPAIKPFGLRVVAEIASVVDVPICGIGGIARWETAVEYMMLGASLVQVGTAAMIYGHGIVQDFTKGLQGFMERKGYSSIKDFVGITNRNYGVGDPYAYTSAIQPRRLVIDDLLCTGCGLCVNACLSSAYGAMRMESGLAIIDQEQCIKCNCCYYSCPTGAIKMEWSA